MKKLLFILMFGCLFTGCEKDPASTDNTGSPEIVYNPVGYTFRVASAKTYTDEIYNNFASTECTGDVILDSNGEIIDVMSTNSYVDTDWLYVFDTDSVYFGYIGSGAGTYYKAPLNWQVNDNILTFHIAGGTMGQEKIMTSDSTFYTDHREYCWGGDFFDDDTEDACVNGGGEWYGCTRSYFAGTFNE